jgi:hypothetical protein
MVVSNDVWVFLGLDGEKARKRTEEEKQDEKEKVTMREEHRLSFANDLQLKI